MSSLFRWEIRWPVLCVWLLFSLWHGRPGMERFQFRGHLLAALFFSLPWIYIGTGRPKNRIQPTTKLPLLVNYLPWRRYCCQNGLNLRNHSRVSLFNKKERLHWSGESRNIIMDSDMAFIPLVGWGDVCGNSGSVASKILLLFLLCTPKDRSGWFLLLVE